MARDRQAPGAGARMRADGRGGAGGGSLARGTGKVATLLLVDANPGIRPSVVAHFILKDRSAMVKLLDQLTRAGLIEQKVSAAERRAHELYLTPKGRALARKVRAIAIEQSESFFSVLGE